jgi:hypothetical protein
MFRREYSIEYGAPSLNWPTLVAISVGVAIVLRICGLC